MLVLSRKKSEVIRIGKDIRVVVVDIRGDKIRLGIDAPKAVSIHRQEIYDQIAAEAVASGTITQGREQLDSEENR